MNVEVRSMGAGRGADWIGEGWAMFKPAWGMWIAVLIVYFVIIFATSMIPFLGSLALNLFSPVFTAGICMGCQSLENGEDLRIEHLFAAFRSDRLGPLVAVGALSMAGVLVLVILAFVLLGGTALLSGGIDTFRSANMGLGGLLMALVILALALPLAMAFWFAAPLVGLAGVAPLDSLKLSFRGCWANILPMFIWSLLAALLMFVAAIPLFLGWLVAMPMMMTAYYRMYRDIFVISPPAL